MGTSLAGISSEGGLIFSSNAIVSEVCPEEIASFTGIEIVSVVLELGAFLK
jgi:hypothetical protein